MLFSFVIPLQICTVAMTVEEILEAIDVNEIPNFVGAKFTDLSMYDFGRCQVVGSGRFQVINAKEEVHMGFFLILYQNNTYLDNI